jgi:hypothetical protein
MSNNKISYLNRTFDDYKASLREYIGQYYPQIASDMNDASVGSWLVDMVAAVSDNLSFYIDKAYNETNLDTANQRNSVYSIARSSGLRVPGPKGSVALCEFSCELDRIGGGDGMPNYDYAPIIKKGTKIASKTQVFEVMNDINFSEQFDYNGFSNRKVIPVMDSNGRIVRYRITKSEVVVAGESKIYKQVLNSPNDIRPFMEIVIPDTNVMNVESIIFKTGVDFQQDPLASEFMTESEEGMTADGVELRRFFEVDSLVDSERWGDYVEKDNLPLTYSYSDAEGNVTYSVTRGEWKPVTQKFITEFTDKGYLKVIFGSGTQIGTDDDLAITGFPAYQITKIVRNNFLGRLPKLGTTMYILYRVGGGAASNVAAGAINRIQYLNAVIGCKSGLDVSTLARVRKSISVTNNYPSVTGKDAPTVDEIKAMIKYNNSAQSRCVTLKDYENRVAMMPPRYGCPFRVSAIEENNKVMMYMLGINSDGTLSDVLPEQLIRNITDYLSKFRTINDFIEMKSGRIVNISVEADIYIDKNYNAGDVMSEAIDVIREFFDINKHMLGETIYLSMLMKEISNISGVLNLMDLRIFNNFSEGYSQSRSIDPVLDSAQSEFVADDEEMAQIDIDATKYLLNSDADAMFEIKMPEKDIRIRSMVR